MFDLHYAVVSPWSVSKAPLLAAGPAAVESAFHPVAQILFSVCSLLVPCGLLILLSDWRLGIPGL